MWNRMILLDRRKKPLKDKQSNFVDEILNPLKIILWLGVFIKV